MQHFKHQLHATGEGIKSNAIHVLLEGLIYLVNWEINLGFEMEIKKDVSTFKVSAINRLSSSSIT